MADTPTNDLRKSDVLFGKEADLYYEAALATLEAIQD